VASLVADHRAAGRRVVIATAYSADDVGPLGKSLGVDAVVSSPLSVRGRHLEAWALTNEVELSSSWAYSDDVRHLPLLRAAGHPVAVNPDLPLAVIAWLCGWPRVHLDLPPGVTKLPILGVELQVLLMRLVRPAMFPWLRVEASGLGHLPQDGPAILVANHRSYMDSLVLALLLAPRRRPLRFFAKAELFDAPLVGSLMQALGAIRVDRGTGSDEPIQKAAAALRNGEVVVILPQGRIPKGRDFFDPKLSGRWGAARLAAITEAPVLPFALWGTEHVWPRSHRLPRVWKVLNPPLVTVRGGPPVSLCLRSPEQDTERIMAAISDELPSEAWHPHDPSPEELRRTYPRRRVTAF
jgi:putative phosphoserine phosphatase/1-acylglycerol-3-phosphate O-acyltransferase